MFQKRRIESLVAGLLALVLIAPACASVNKSINIGDNVETDGQSTVNGSISVGSGSTVSGSLHTVNGTIRVAENTRLRDVETVNGSIRIDSGSSADDIESVNGSISLAENVTVEGGIEVVNGKITLGKGTTVADDVENVNGEMELSGADIGGDILTVNGDISLVEGTVLHGNLKVSKPGGWSWNNDKDRRKPRIVIGPGARVMGNIELERAVELFISESAEVGGVSGEMGMDDAVRFSGNHP
jgi:hypothetical protein